MKSFLFLMMVAVPLLTHAGDSGWAERGNGNEFKPPPCKPSRLNPLLPGPPTDDQRLLYPDGNAPNCEAGLPRPPGTPGIVY